MASKLDGSYVLLKINGTTVAGQTDSTMSLDAEMVNVIISGGRFSEVLTGKISYNVNVSIVYDDATWLTLYNAFKNGTDLSMYMGGVNVGDVYFTFNAKINGISRSHPMGGLSVITLSVVGNGEPTYSTVV
ncbi:MAG TPA: hypothetical protein PL079_10170 [Tenuifilaceae bacterium]|nr:hypothetical protein [Tenuifilaceae bacterium]